MTVAGDEYEDTQAATVAVQRSLAAVAERNARIDAWAYLDPERAVAEAAVADRRYPDASLYGVVVAAKDIFDTHDMPTAYGSPLYKNHLPSRDAALITLLRDQGAVVLGKTRTTEFASSFAATTRNPRNTNHSPGGSSSGSAAAVASGMVDLALGSQTLGSIIRPASYCGVYGFKPSYGRISRTGVLCLSETLDTLGVLGSSLDHIEKFHRVVTSDSVRSQLAFTPRLGYCEGPNWDAASLHAKEAFAEFVQAVRERGISVEKVELPTLFEELPAAGITIHDYEVYRNFAWERCHKADGFSKNFRDIIARGARISNRGYEEALKVGEKSRGLLPGVFDDFDALITLSATGEAPEGLSSTGSPALNIAWTLLRGPCVSLPKLSGPKGLPIGVQVIGAPFSDVGTLRCAEWIDNAVTAEIGPATAFGSDRMPSKATI
jgi:Asp-tRNA(Asn)/Glu-tRNA(Gln) amidotransferase A subunit family amidase